MRVRRSIRRPGTLVPLVLAGLALIPLVDTFWNPVIRLDGHGYYAPLASIVFDRDFDLRNEFVHAEPFMRSTYFTRPDGRVVDPFAVGAALLWSPAIVVTSLFASDLAPPTTTSVQAGSRGYQRRYVRAVALATAVQALLGCALLYIALRCTHGVFPAAAGVTGAALGTPLVYYALAQPSYAHAASFLAVSALLLAVLRDRERSVPIAVLGALWGFVALVRWQDAVLGLLVAPRLVDEIRGLRVRPATTLGRLALFLAAALLVFMPQLVFWNSVYGSAFVYTHAGFMRWTEPQVLPLLFSIWHGALVYSPLFLGTLGLVFVRDHRLRWAALAAVGLAIYASAAAGDWWGGGGFSARRLTSIAPLVGLGIAATVTRSLQVAHARLPTWRTILVVAWIGVATAWNLRVAHYNVESLLPFNPSAPQDYIRHYPRGDPRREIYRLWDYRRLAGELIEAERRMWSEKRR